MDDGRHPHERQSASPARCCRPEIVSRLVLRRWCARRHRGDRRARLWQPAFVDRLTGPTAHMHRHRDCVVDCLLLWPGPSQIRDRACRGDAATFRPSRSAWAGSPAEWVRVRTEVPANAPPGTRRLTTEITTLSALCGALPAAPASTAFAGYPGHRESPSHTR